MRIGLATAALLLGCTIATPPATPSAVPTVACAPTIARMVPPRQVMDFMLDGARRPAGATAPPNPTVEVRPQLWASDKNWLGDGALWIELPPGGVTRGLGEKIPVYRIASGRIAVDARRLDGGGTATPSLPDYGDRGFQSTGVEFSTAGCWELVYSMADHRLSFVLKVEGRQP